MTGEAEPQRANRLLSGGQTLVVVGALLLPVAGAVIRYVRFRSLGFADPSHLAISAPLGALAAEGLWPFYNVLTSMGFGVVLVVLIARSSRSLFLIGMFVTYLIGTAVLFGPVMLLLGAAGVVAFYFAWHVRIGRSPWSGWGMVVFLTIYALSALFYGLIPFEAHTEAYTLDSEVVEDGDYIGLGQTETMFILAPCDGSRSYFEVPIADVTSIVVQPIPQSVEAFPFDPGVLRSRWALTFYGGCR